MRRFTAWSVVGGAAALTLAAFVAPILVVGPIALASVFVMRRGRLAFLAFAATAMLLNGLVIGLSAAGFRAIDPTAALAGVTGGVRVAAALGANLAILSRASPAAVLDGLRLPPRATALLAAVTIGAQDVGRDFARLRLARELSGAWPEGRIARLRAAAALMPALMVAAHRRAGIRSDALRLVGRRMPAWFVPVVAVAALAAAGRMALVVLPNVALTFVVVFLAGVLFGARIAAFGGALAMALTNLLLSGLYPPAFVNVPAMALVGLFGAALRGIDFVGANRAERAAGVTFAAAFGVLATVMFSVATDAATWLLLYADRPDAFAPLVAAGLAFNAIPALANGAVFALSVAPTVRAFAATRDQAASPSPASRTEPGRDDPPAPLGTASSRS